MFCELLGFLWSLESREWSCLGKEQIGGGHCGILPPFIESEVCGSGNLTTLSFICIMDAFLSIMQMGREEN